MGLEKTAIFIIENVDGGAGPRVYLQKVGNAVRGQEVEGGETGEIYLAT
jgi:hypothetical protein